MLARDQADDRVSAVWEGLNALGRGRPHLLLEGESPSTYVVRWQSSPVPAYVLAGRLRRVLPGSTILSVRSVPSRGGVGRSIRNGKLEARHSITIEFTIGLGPDPLEERLPCVEG